MNVLKSLKNWKENANAVKKIDNSKKSNLWKKVTLGFISILLVYCLYNSNKKYKMEEKDPRDYIKEEKITREQVIVEKKPIVLSEEKKNYEVIAPKRNISDYLEVLDKKKKSLKVEKQGIPIGGSITFEEYVDQLPGEGTKRPKVSFMTGEIIPEQEEEESIVKATERVTLEEVIADINLMDLTQTALKKRIKSLIREDVKDENDLTNKDIETIYYFIEEAVQIEELKTLTKNMKTKIWSQDRNGKWVLGHPTSSNWKLQRIRDIFSQKTYIEHVCKPEERLNTEIWITKDRTQLGVVNLVCGVEAAEKAGIDVSKLERIGNSMTTVVLEKFDYAGNPVEYNV